MQKKSKFNVFTFMMLIILGLTFQPAILSYAACLDGISSYWKLDEAAGPVYADFIKGNDGVGNVNPTAVTGIVNGAQKFNGSGIPSTITEINVAADRSFDWYADKSFSIEYWINRDAPGAIEVAVGRDDSTSQLHWWTGLNSEGKASFVLRAKDDSGGAGDLVGVGPVIADGDWHHVVAVRDGVNDKNLLYVDGVEVGNLTDGDVTYTDGFDSTSSALNIGWLNLSPSFFHFEGTLDEVALYDRALLQTEIQDHHTAGLAGNDYCSGVAPFVPFPDDTISLWNLDETPIGASAIYADAFDGNDGVGNVNPTAVTGIVNGAQKFNGSGIPSTITEINVAADRSFDWYADESFSIEYWINRDAPGAIEVAVGRDDSTSQLHWWTGLNSEGKASFVLRAKDDSGGAGDLVGVGPVIADGDWHHVVAVRDGVNDKNLLYVDGVEVGNLTDGDVTYTDGFDSTSSALNIGWLNLSPSFFHFEGTLDEVALYDRALLQTEIQDHHTAGLAGKGIDSSRPAPVADAGDDQANVVETTEVTLDGIGSVEGYTAAPITTYLWEQTDGTDVGTITDADKITATFDAPDVVAAGETLKFQLTVTASDGQSSSDTVDVGVVENILPDAPDADAGDPQTVTEGDPVTLDGTESTPVGGISYLWVQTDGTQVLPAAGVQAATATFTAPQVDSNGETLKFQLTVTDNDDLTLKDSDTVTVTVNDNPLAPTADAGADQDVKEGNTVTLDGSNSSPAAGSTITTYLWVQTSGTKVQLAGSSTATATFTAPDVDETLIFQLTVTDDDGLTSSDTTDVNVSKSGGGGGGGGGGGCFINSMF